MTQHPPNQGSTEEELMEEVGLISGKLFEVIAQHGTTAVLIALTGSIATVLETLPSGIKAQMLSNTIKTLRSMK